MRIGADFDWTGKYRGIKFQALPKNMPLQLLAGSVALTKGKKVRVRAPWGWVGGWGC